MEAGDSNNDERELNYSPLRMLFCSVAGGHTFLLSRRMLEYLPIMKKFPRLYDVPLQIIAGALDSLIVVPHYTQYHRMHAKSATYYKQVNNKKTLGNALSYATQSFSYYRELRPVMRNRMQQMHNLLLAINPSTPPRNIF